MSQRRLTCSKTIITVTIYSCWYEFRMKSIKGPKFKNRENRQCLYKTLSRLKLLGDMKNATMAHHHINRCYAQSHLFITQSFIIMGANSSKRRVTNEHTQTHTHTVVCNVYMSVHFTLHWKFEYMQYIKFINTHLGRRVQKTLERGLP